MKGISIVVAAIALLFAPASMAASYILQFSGQTADTVEGGVLRGGGATFSGSLVLDFDTPDVQSFDDVGSYDGIVTSATVTINGITYSGPSGVINIGGVSNDQGATGDFFGVGVHLSNGKSDEGFFAIQFQDSSGLAFVDDSLPLGINLADFDDFDPNNSFSTGAFLPFLTGLGGESIFVALGSATLTQVPLPAGVWLFMSAMSAFLWRRRA